MINALKFEFSEAQRRRMDHDLYLLHGLAERVREAFQGIMVITSGWASDALCGGKATRFHHDVDADVIVPIGVELPDVFDCAETVYQQNSTMRWQREGSHPSWTTLCVADDTQLENPMDGGRLDLHGLHSSGPMTRDGVIEIVSRQGKTYPMHLQKVSLMDTCGKSYKFYAPTAESLITTKLQLIHSMKDIHEREFSPTDVYDLRRLFGLPGLRTDQVVRGLQSYYMKVQKMDREQARYAVCDQFDRLARASVITHDILSQVDPHLGRQLLIPTESRELSFRI